MGHRRPSLCSESIALGLADTFKTKNFGKIAPQVFYAHAACCDPTSGCYALVTVTSVRGQNAQPRRMKLCRVQNLDMPSMGLKRQREATLPKYRVRHTAFCIYAVLWTKLDCLTLPHTVFGWVLDNTFFWYCNTILNTFCQKYSMQFQYFPQKVFNAISILCWTGGDSGRYASRPAHTMCGGSGSIQDPG